MVGNHHFHPSISKQLGFFLGSRYCLVAKVDDLIHSPEDRRFDRTPGRSLLSKRTPGKRWQQICWEENCFLDTKVGVFPKIGVPQKWTVYNG